MGNGISQHIRGNVVGYVALFFALSASAYALPGTNTVDTGDIVNGQVRSPDIGAGQVGTTDLANNSVNSVKVANNSLTGGDIANGKVSVLDLATGSVNSSKVADNSLTGADVAESTLGQVPSAQNATTAANADTLDSLNSTDFLGTNSQAGGDLGGPLSNLQIAGNAVGTSEVADNSLTGGDVNESTLVDVGGVMAGKINDVGSSGSTVGSPSGTSTAGARATVEFALPGGDGTIEVSELHVRNSGFLPATGSRTISLTDGALITPFGCTIPANGFECESTGSRVLQSGTFAVHVLNTGSGLAATDDITFGMTTRP
jgi:hypothetical protein